MPPADQEVEPMSDDAWDPYNRNCPTRQLLSRLGDRGTILLVGALTDGPRRYSQLAQTIDGVSQKMLTQTLCSLERDGLVTRTVHAQVPPHVEYELTELGRSLREPLKALERWSTGNMSAVLHAQSAYDAQKA